MEQGGGGGGRAKRIEWNKVSSVVGAVGGCNHFAGVDSLRVLCSSSSRLARFARSPPERLDELNIPIPQSDRVPGSRIIRVRSRNVLNTKGGVGVENKSTADMKVLDFAACFKLDGEIPTRLDTNGDERDGKLNCLPAPSGIMSVYP